MEYKTYCNLKSANKVGYNAYNPNKNQENKNAKTVKNELLQ